MGLVFKCIRGKKGRIRFYLGAIWNFFIIKIFNLFCSWNFVGMSETEKCSLVCLSFKKEKANWLTYVHVEVFSTQRVQLVLCVCFACLKVGSQSNLESFLEFMALHTTLMFTIVFLQMYPDLISIPRSTFAQTGTQRLQFSKFHNCL